MSSGNKNYVSEDESAGYASPALDIVAAVALSALSIWIMVESMALKSPAAITTAPGLLPFVTAGMLLVMSIVLGVSAVLRQRSVPISIVQDIPKDLPRVGILIAILVAYISALEVLSFSKDIELGVMSFQITAFEPVSIVVLTTILRIFWTPHLWACLLVAAVWIFVLSIAFQKFMTIPMPG
ncbi:MAG: hypothetical protein ACR2PG_11295 [Hyphomicrobiaceae bacterium]